MSTLGEGSERMAYYQAHSNQRLKTEINFLRTKTAADELLNRVGDPFEKPNRL